MKKLYVVVLLLALIGLNNVSAQLRSDKKQLIKSLLKDQFKTTNKPTFASKTSGAGCDTINAAATDTFRNTLYGNFKIGFVSGVNEYEDMEKAAYFYDTLNNTILNKVFIYVAFANSNKPANMNKIIPIHVYDGTGLAIKDKLTTVNKTLAEIKLDVDNNRLTEVVFPGGVALPASKEFFISVDVSNLVWDSTNAAATKDTFAIWSTTNGDLNDINFRDQFNGIFFEKLSDSTWIDGYSSWNLDLNLFIFPVVGTSPNCGVLPITLSKFSGERLAVKNMLTWVTQTEQNSKGFEIQRSADGLNFSTLQFIQSQTGNGNSTKSLTYTFDDVKALKGDNYYRLKQIDKDGKYTYSSIVTLKGGKVVTMELNNIYPNPAKNNVSLVVSSPVNSKVIVMISDLTGRLMMQKTTQVISGENTLKLNVEKITSGTYFIKVVCADGCETGVQKFVKQ